ncbi:MAG: tyrosine-type recombinase/integrase [Defluviitaleaceae bacterium]|nr:tyrosine-type recombinase/integrase [Defluviitaleaceae bacterium]
MQTLKELVKLVEKEMNRQQYNVKTIKVYRREWERLIEYAEGAEISHFTSELGEKFLMDVHGIDWRDPFSNPAYQRDQVNVRRRPIAVLSQFQIHGTFLRNDYYSDNKVKTIFSGLMDEYVIHCKKRYNAEKTILYKERAVTRFMLFIEGKGVVAFETITPEHISDYVKTFIHAGKRTVATQLGELRMFLRFAHEKGYVQKDLSCVVPQLNSRRSNELPTIWSEEEIQRILSVVDRSNAEGKRSYAIYMLVINYGLRNSDICNLRFENIDWNSNKIFIIQDKTKEPLILPLRPDIGEAIIDYMKYGRPKIDLPYIFIRHHAPYDKVSNFYHILRRDMNLAGVKFEPHQKKGLHTLRFTLASKMLAENVPIETISSVLGHKTIHSTKIYLSVDLQHLRDCALNPEEVFENV